MLGLCGTAITSDISASPLLVTANTLSPTRTWDISRVSPDSITTDSEPAKHCFSVRVVDGAKVAVVGVAVGAIVTVLLQYVET